MKHTHFEHFRAWKQIIVLGVIISVIIAIITLFCLRRGYGSTSLEDTLLPKETFLVIHFSTSTSSGTINPLARSEIAFYDNAGEIISTAYIPEEVWGDFIVETSNGLTYFFQNQIVQTSERNVSILSDLETDLNFTRFVPSSVGYVEKLDQSFVLLNIGSQLLDKPYTNILRFATANSTYDVVIPYYLERAYYDATTNKFICVIEPSAINKVADQGFVDYVEVVFDVSTQRFSLENTVHHLKNDTLGNLENRINSRCMVKDNVLYQVSLIAGEMSSNSYGHGNLVLSTYNLKTDELMENRILLNHYTLGPYGGMLVGSSDLPMTVKGQKLYAFASTKQVLIISDESHIKKLEMPYLFENTVPVSSPYYTDYNSSKDFSDTIVHVEDDGEIYVLCLFRNHHLRLYRLLNNSEYELCWEGMLPGGLAADMTVNDFEVINS